MASAATGPDEGSTDARSVARPCLITLVLAVLVFAAAATVLIWQPWRTTVPPWQLALRIDVSRCDGKSGVASAFGINATTLVTNRHVVEDAERLRVRTWDGRPLRIRETLKASSFDIGVIRLDQPIVHVLPMRDHDPVRGELVIAVGYPEGGVAVAGRGRVIDYADGSDVGEPTRIIRSTAATAPGSSGGPLLDARHRVVGLIFAIDKDSGLTLAIPASKLRPALDDVDSLTKIDDQC